MCFESNSSQLVCCALSLSLGPFTSTTRTSSLLPGLGLGAGEPPTDVRGEGVEAETTEAGVAARLLLTGVTAGTVAVVMGTVGEATIPSSTLPFLAFATVATSALGTAEREARVGVAVADERAGESEGTEGVMERGVEEVERGVSRPLLSGVAVRDFVWGVRGEGVVERDGDCLCFLND